MAEKAPDVLICGFGSFGQLHARAWRHLDANIRLMVCDPLPAAQAAARSMGIASDAIGCDIDKFIQQADIVDIVTPPQQHFAIALRSIRAGKPMLIEKPAVTNVEDAISLATLAVKVPVQIGMVLRCHPLTTRAQKLLQSGAIGRLIRCEGDFSGWKRMRADASLLENDGVHFIDLMRHFTGSPIHAIDVQSKCTLDPEVVDDIRLEMTFKSGVSGHLRLGVLVAGEYEDSFVPNARTTKRITLIGTEGNLALDFNSNRLRHSRVSYQRNLGGFDVAPGDVNDEIISGVTPVSLLSDSFGIFVDALNNGGDVMCDVTQGALEIARVLNTLTIAQPPRQMHKIKEIAE